MKKSIFIVLLFVGITIITSYCQVTKTDIEADITAVGGSSKFTFFKVTNVRILYNDGTTPYTWYDYTYSESGYELTATSIVLKSFTDNTKSAIKNVSICPYDNIAFFSVTKDGLTIRLKNTLLI